MKLFLSLLFLGSLAIFAQPTIESTDFFDANDTARISVTTDGSIDFSTTGPNSVWDFAYLQANSQRLEEAFSIASAGVIVNFQFGPTAPPNYVSSYYRPFDGIPFDQLGNFLPVNIEDINRIIKKDTDSLTYTGYSFKVDGQQVGFRSDTIETGYKFPLNFGDTYSSRGYTNMDFNPIFNAQFIQYRQRESVVDGHGTLITPYSTFNATRIHHTITEQDSFYVEIQGFGTWIPIERTIHEYEWWAKDEMRPVMLIQTEEIGGSENVTGITYRDIYLGLDASLNEYSTLGANIYPNPTRELVNVNSEYLIDGVSIYSLQGALVLSKEPKDNTFSIDIKHLDPGVYSLIIEASQGRQITKIVIE